MKSKKLKNSLSNLDWEIILEKLADFASCEEAKSQLHSLTPLKTAEQALESFSQITEVKNLLKEYSRPLLESLDLYGLWIRRLEQCSTLKSQELKDVRLFLLEVLEIKEVCEKLENSLWLNQLAQEFMDAEEPLSAIDQIVTPGGEVRTDASEKLYNLFKEKNALGSKIQKTLDQMVKKFDMQTILQDNFVTSRSGRWVIPVKSGMQHEFDGIIHAQSHSKQTVFMEPNSIVPMNNRLQQVKVEIEDEIESLLKELTEYLHGRVDEIAASKELLLQFDIWFSKAQLSQALSAKTIDFSKDNIKLLQLGHPLLLLNNDSVIRNNVELDQKRRILLLSGPNAGGKTVLLKSIGLAHQMARCGLHVCASDESSLPFMTEIFASIGDQQSVDENLSTFAAHLKSLNESLEAQGPDHLVLVDEICGSTDPEEGAALARSFIHQYAAHNCFAVVTSHLSPLKMGWKEGSGVINGSLEYNKESGQPSYNFLLGVPGESLAIKTAIRVGVEDKVIHQALEFMSPEAKRYLDRLQEVEILKEQVGQLNTELKQKISEQQKEKQKYKKLIEIFEHEKSQRLDDELVKFKEELNEQIRTAKVDSVFKKHEALEKVKSELPKVVKAQPQQEKSIESIEDFKKYLPPGSKVFIQSLNRDGIVQSEPNGKGEVTVMSESIRLSVSWKLLDFPKSTANKQPKSFSASQSTQMLHDRVVDLRGVSVEEALATLEVQLDTAALNQEDRLKVIHGHGTNALKKSVRSYLSRSTYVRKWSAGQEHTGGDGITWVYL